MLNSYNYEAHHSTNLIIGRTPDGSKQTIFKQDNLIKKGITTSQEGEDSDAIEEDNFDKDFQD